MNLNIVFLYNLLFFYNVKETFDFKQSRSFNIFITTVILKPIGNYSMTLVNII